MPSPMETLSWRSDSIPASVASPFYSPSRVLLPTSSGSIHSPPRLLLKCCRKPSYNPLTWLRYEVGMIACTVACVLLITLVIVPSLVIPVGWLRGERALHASTPDVNTPHTLVLYAWANNDPYYHDNLQFFIDEGMPGCPGCRYVIIVNDNDPEIVRPIPLSLNQYFCLNQMKEMPELPDNAVYVRHANECFDWGTFGWVFKTGVVNTEGFKYFVFMNPSVRGPFLPPGVRGLVHFTEVLTSKLNDDVKLVGPNVNCGGMFLPGTTEYRTLPHVQSFVAATDAVGLDLMLQDEFFFGCYDVKRTVIYHSELGAANIMLENGYNLDSLTTAYQGIDWRDKDNWECNGSENPLKDSLVEGNPLNLFELMFVKVKYHGLDQENPLLKSALVYSKWMQRSTAGARTEGGWKLDTKWLEDEK